MRKIYTFIMIITTIIFLSACQKPELYRMFFNYMGTETDILILVNNEAEGIEHREKIDEIYKTYHDLSQYLVPPSEDFNFKENIFTINSKPNEELEIDVELYDLIVEAERIRVLTNGYFDISIGHIVNVWKDLSQTYQYEEIPQSVFESTLETIEDLEVKEDAITLWEESDRYYILIKDEIKLDLGAIAKGYSTEIVKNYIISEGIEYFSISGGSSSISLGKNFNRETELFHVSLANPVRTSSIDRTYGMIFVQNTGVTTSGNYIQYANYDNLRYHHIVSPITKMPEHYYHTVTIIGENLGLLDAVSTAMFSMPPHVFDMWFNQYKDELSIEIIRFNYDESITQFLTDTVFEENQVE